MCTVSEWPCKADLNWLGRSKHTTLVSKRCFWPNSKMVPLSFDYKIPATSHSRKNLAQKNEPVETHY